MKNRSALFVALLSMTAGLALEPPPVPPARRRTDPPPPPRPHGPTAEPGLCRFTITPDEGPNAGKPIEIEGTRGVSEGPIPFVFRPPPTREEARRIRQAERNANRRRGAS